MPNRAEEFASKAMGAVKSAKAAVHGLSGIFKRLSEEHGEVTALLLRVKTSSDKHVRAELFPKIRKELLAHEKGELLELYPAYRAHEETREIAEHHAQEAGELEHLIEQLHALPFDHERWKPTFDRLVERVEHHAKEEESKFFPVGQRVLGTRADELLANYENAKKELLEEVS